MQNAQSVHLPRAPRRDQDRHQAGRRADVRSEGKGVQVVNEPGKARRFGKIDRPHAGLEEGLREPRPGPDHRLRSQGEGLSVSTMALIKMKPTSPGTRTVDQGRPLAPAQGRAVAPLTGHAEQDRRAQSLRPHHHAPRRRRLAPEVSPHRLQARQRWHRRCRRARRVRPEPHRATSR